MTDRRKNGTTLALFAANSRHRPQSLKDNPKQVSVSPLMILPEPLLS
jgi:hypothetical protein